MNIIKKSLLVASIAFIPSISFGAGEVTSVVRQLETLSSMLKQQNSDSQWMTTPVIELASQSEQDVHYFIVPGNVQVTIVGVCDQNCSGFGLKVIDENNRIVGQDNGMDGSNFSAVKGNSVGEQSREIRVIGTMSNCKTSSCVYGIGVTQVPLQSDLTF
jgi:hypothetical protein